MPIAALIAVLAAALGMATGLSVKEQVERARTHQH
jgi:hypothetical protein